MRKMRTYREYLIEIFTDPKEAIEHLQVALEDYQTYGNTDVFLFLLQTVVEAQGGVSKLAKQNDMDPQQLSKALTNEKTPLIDALGIVLKALGYQLSIKPIGAESLDSEIPTQPLAEQHAPARVAESPTHAASDH